MTVYKEKAVDLLNKYMEITETKYDAVDCAVLAVDEILSELNFISSMDAVKEISFEFWTNVRQELLKL